MKIVQNPSKEVSVAQWVVQAQPGDGSFCFDPQKVIINDILRYSISIKDSSRYSCASDTIIFVKTEFTRGPGRGDTCHLSFLDETVPD